MDAQIVGMEAGGFPPHLSEIVSRAIQSIIFEPGTDMKYILILSIIAALLGGCVIVPAGYGDNRDGYYKYNDGNYRNYSYRSDRGNQGYAYRDHSG
jgi:hypothetical protein